MKKSMIRAIALLSGGLDSRLAIKLIQEQGIEVIALYFNLPFSSGCCLPDSAFNFAQTQRVKLQIVDCTRGKNFNEYLRIVRKPKHGYGSAINPCIDCRIFMLKKAKQLMSKLKASFIVTGEVLNERPMSQTKRALMLIEQEAGLENKILRPLSAKLLPETEVEKQNLVDRKQLMAISGKSRKPQMALARQYRISYPSPAGGCLLCEKAFAPKLVDLFRHQKKIAPRDIELLRLGRHFRYCSNKIVIGRNEQENKTLIKLAGNNLLFEVEDWPSPITLLQGKANKKAIKIAAGLTVAHSDARAEEAVTVRYGKRKLNKSLKISSLDQETIEKLRVR